MDKTKAAKIEAGKLLEKWKSKLFLHGWQVDAKFKDCEHSSGRVVYAECWPDRKASMTEIHFFAPFYELGKYERERVVVHELVHCLTEGMKDMTVDLHNGKLIHIDTLERENEILTNSISAILMDLDVTLKEKRTKK